jgi:hypothetical protein
VIYLILGFAAVVVFIAAPEPMKRITLMLVWLLGAGAVVWALVDAVRRLS